MTRRSPSVLHRNAGILAARAAGKLLRRYFAKDLRIDYKGDGNLVTEADRVAEALIVRMIRRQFPDHRFLAEEGGDHPGAGRSDSEHKWIIDPLDGTTNFIHGVPAFAISVALQQKEKTIAGWVLEVPSNTLYFAEAGCGATKNGFPITVSPEPEFAKSLLATGFPYSKNGLPADYLSVLAEFVKHTHGVRRFGAAALDLVWVAEGRFEGFYEIGLHPWDVAAGILIIQEAGGQISTFSETGDPLFGRQILASNGLIHKEMMAVLRPYSHLFPA